MKFEQWLEDAEAKFEMHAEEERGSDYFRSRIFRITDPNRIGLSFEISLFEDGEPSMFTAKPFEFRSFSIAEGATRDSILSAASCCLQGNLKFRKHPLSRKLRLEFPSDASILSL